MTYTIDNAMNAASMFSRTLSVMHSIDTKELSKPSELFVDLYGTDSYTDSLNNEVHLGIQSIFAVYKDFIKTDSDFYSFTDFTRKHECCHLYYTGGRSYTTAIKAGVREIYKYIAKQEGNPILFRKQRDEDIFAKHLNETYDPRMSNFITNISASIVNCIEDGRIERIHSAKNPGFAKERMYVRGTCFWDNQKSSCIPYEQLSSMEHLQVLIGQILTLSKCQVYQKGFVKTYATTPLLKEVEAIMPFISEGYLAKSTKGLISVNEKISKCLAPFIFEAAKELKSSTNTMLEEIFKQLLQLLLTQIAENENFGDTDYSAADDDTDSFNSALPFSNLTITLPDEVYDKLMQKTKENNDESSNSITVKREHPLSEEDDKEKKDNGSGSGNAESNTKKPSKDETSQAKKNSSSAQDNNDSEEGDNAQNANSGSSSENSENEKGSRNSSSAGNPDEFDEKFIEEQMKRAAENFRASAEEALNNINRSNVSGGAKKAKTPVVKNTDAPISPKDVKDICKFKELRRAYEVTEKLPPMLQAKGDTLHREISRYFKSLQEPNVRFRRSGTLDTNALSKLAKNDTKVFMKKGKSKLVDGCVYILVDNSGSMGKVKRRAACQAAAVIEEGFKGLMPMKIVAFDESGLIIHEVIKGWDERLDENCCWNFCLKGRHGSGNDDEKDIRIAARELLKRPESKKILIVLSDGAPINCNKTKKAISDARSAGIQVSGIYFEEGNIEVHNANFVNMYEKDYVCCNINEIEKNLTKILRKFAHSK